MKIAFDINGTLKRTEQVETQAMLNLLKILKKAGHFIIVWSGDDIEEIKKFISSNQLEPYVDSAICKLNIKSENLPDIAFDDSDFAYLAKLATIKV